jgi:chromosome segregation ATPase
MTDYDTQIRTLQDRLSTAQRQRIRAEHERDQAQAAADAARTRLTTEFGVTDLDAAHQLLDKLRAELETHLAELAARLDELGA